MNRTNIVSGKQATLQVRMRNLIGKYIEHVYILLLDHWYPYAKMFDLVFICRHKNGWRFDINGIKCLSQDDS